MSFGRLLRFASELCPAFVTSLLALACDPSAAPLRDCVEATLATILSTLGLQELSAVRTSHTDAVPWTPADSDLSRVQIATSVTKAYQRQGPQTQLEVLRAVPHDTQNGKLLRKCVALAWLVRPGHDQDEVSLVGLSRRGFEESH